MLSGPISRSSNRFTAAKFTGVGVGADMKQPLRLCSHFIRHTRRTRAHQKQCSIHGPRLFTTSTPRSYADVQDDKREHIVVLGSGWAGYVCARNLDAKKYKVTVISPRTYFVFTPLLTDTAVGTLEFRHILEAVRRANRDIEFIQGWADDVNFVQKTIDVEPSVLDPHQSHALVQDNSGTAKENMLTPREEVKMTGGAHMKDHVPVFSVKYDKLVVTVGAYSQTFGTPGVKEHAYFLKDVGDARKIRSRILELFELCRLPFLNDETRGHLLHFAVVGAGPTGMEFAGNLSDLINEDMARYHPHLIKFVKITMYDVAPKVLPMFDAALAEYATKLYKRKNIDVRTSHHVEFLRKGHPNDPECVQHQEDIPSGRVFTIKTKEDGEVGCGMCIWSTGVMSNPFVAKALSHVRKFPPASAKITHGEPAADTEGRQWMIQRHPKIGSLLVDDHFRVQLETEPEAEGGNKSEPQAQAVMNDVFAVGDCATIKNLNSPLPATAQVANQEAHYLSKAFNRHYSHSTNSFDVEAYEKSEGFNFHNRGVMTFLGSSKAILQGPHVDKSGAGRGLRGFIAYALWRGAYLTMTLSWRNKVLIPVQWLAVKIFGRSISRF